MTGTSQASVRAQTVVASASLTAPTQVFEWDVTSEGELVKLLIVNLGTGDATVTLWLYSPDDAPGAGVQPDDALTLCANVRVDQDDVVTVDDVEGVPLRRGDVVVATASAANYLAVLIAGHVR